MDTKQITSQLIFLRHGEKDEEGKLTKSGLDQARRAGLVAQDIGGDIMLFHSGVGRVRDTIRTMAAHLNMTPDETASYELGSHIVDYVSPNLHYLHDPSVKGDFFSHWDDIELTEENIHTRMKNFLSTAEPEEGVALSARKMAQNIAQMIGIEVRFANMTDLNHKVQFVNGTHEPVLMSFIYYFLNNFQPVSPDFIDKIGGSIDYAESFIVTVCHSSLTNFDVTFRFRDIEKPLNLDALRAFAYAG